MTPFRCYVCRVECVPVGSYDGMWPSDRRCPMCGSVYDGDTGDLRYIKCDPCQFCQCAYDDSDRSVGLEGMGCTFYDTDATEEDEGWECGCGRPCRGFRSIPASESLIWQLEEEAMAETYSETQEGEE